MKKVKEVLENQIEAIEKVLAESRARFDETENGHPYTQARVAQDIAIAAAKLDALKNLYKILGFKGG